MTIFGESAGAMMTSILFLNSHIERFARAAVCILQYMYYFPFLTSLGKIFQSGSANSPATFKAARREIDWQNFVGGVPHCASLAKTGKTFSCLKTANSSEIYQGLLTSLDKSPEEFGFDPTIDGPGGILPDIPSRLYAQGHFSRLPFIAGNTLDEGKVPFL